MLPLAEAAPTSGSTTVILLGALFAGGLVGALFNVYLRWRKGPIDDALQMQQAQDVARKASQELFVTYRVELEQAKKQLSEYLDQLVKVNRDLGAAEARIGLLESELREARTEVERTRRLEQELEAARQRRAELEKEVKSLLERIRAVEEKTSEQ